MKTHALLLVVSMVPSSAWAQGYEALVLEPAPGHAWTIGTGAADTHFAGYGARPGEDFPARARAVLFDALGGFLDVTPPNASGALINDSFAGQHAGGATVLGGYPAYAYLWNGATPVNVHPAGYSVSELLGVGGGKQVGYVVASFYCAECGRFVQRHAGVWQGSAASFRRLHSRRHAFTRALGTDGTQHVGHGQVVATGAEHALLWTGSASLATDLHPRGYQASLAAGVWGGQQAGSVWGDPTDGYTHAASWTGTARSFRDLNPAGYLQSVIHAVRRGVQVGSGSLHAESWRYRALAWRGTAASVIDLHTVLPAAYQEWNSSAEDVDGDGNIVGLVEQSGEFRPVVWRRLP